MKTYIINMLLRLLSEIITEDMVKSLFAVLLNALEQFVKDTDNEYDEKVIVPLLRVVRSAFDLPDDEERR